MRLRLALVAKNSNELTANYNYPLSAAIYNLLHFGSPEFSSFLHDIGFNLNGKKFKLFTFSLRFEDAKFSDGKVFMNSRKAYLLVSSPLIEDFIKNFVIGTFESQKITLHWNFRDTIFNISQVECLPEPEIYDKMKFLMLSPMVLSTRKDNGNTSRIYFYRYDDDNISTALTNNLKNKYKLIYGNIIETEDITLEWDSDYIKRQLDAGKRISTKTTIDESNKKIDVIGIKAPFILKGNKELIKTGYQCGFGEKNSMGFGMTDIFSH